MRIAVVILAGGEGRRIGGQKAQRLLGGQRLADRAEELARQWSDVLGVAVRKPSQIARTTLGHIVDEPDIDGPLGGLVAALRFAEFSGCEAVLTIPVDLPFLPDDLMDRLSGTLGTHGVAIASSGGHLHPVCGLWRTGALEMLSDYLAFGKRSLKGFAEMVGYAVAEWPTEPFDPFFNVNSAEDLVQAEQLLGAWQSKASLSLRE